MSIMYENQNVCDLSSNQVPNFSQSNQLDHLQHTNQSNFAHCNQYYQNSERDDNYSYQNLLQVQSISEQYTVINCETGLSYINLDNRSQDQSLDQRSHESYYSHNSYLNHSNSDLVSVLKQDHHSQQNYLNFDLQLPYQSYYNTCSSSNYTTNLQPNNTFLSDNLNSDQNDENKSSVPPPPPTTPPYKWMKIKRNIQKTNHANFGTFFLVNFFNAQKKNFFL